jgi:hypothetical protein
MYKSNWSPTEGERRLHLTEEIRMSTDYSDRRTWIRMLRVQIEQGGSRFQGPPGLRERMERLYAYITAQKTT